MLARLHTKALAWGTLTLLLCAVASRAQAETLYSNLGPGEIFGNAGTLVGGPGAIAYYSLGVGFIASAGGQVSSIEVPFHYESGNTAGSVKLTLFADNGSAYPAFDSNPLDVFTLPAAQLTPNLVLYSLGSTLHPVLTSGALYWLIAEASGDLMTRWATTRPFSQVGYRYADNNPRTPEDGVVTPFDSGAAFRVNGGPVNAVPEPSSLVMLVSLVLTAWGTVVVRRQNRMAANA